MKTKYPCLSLVPELVLATMKGEKTQTRRKIQTALEWDSCQTGVNIHGQTYAALHNSSYGSESIEFPQYQPGQILWVRESAEVLAASSTIEKYQVRLKYAADSKNSDWFDWPSRLKAQPELGHKIPNGIFREAARTFVKITDVRVERLQDISEEDVRNEGLRFTHSHDGKGVLVETATYPFWYPSPQSVFGGLWQSIYGIESWNSNPYVFAYSYELTERPHDFLTSK